MNIEEAIGKLKDTVKQCHNSKECWENESCSDCYVEIEDIKAIETLLNEYEKQQDRINKAIELLEQELKHCEQEKQDYNICHIQVKIQKHLLKILKGE